MSPSRRKFLFAVSLLAAALGYAGGAVALEKRTLTHELEVEVKVRRNLKTECSQLVADQSDLDLALQTCDAAVEEAPEDGDRYYFRSYARYYREEYEAAEADATRAIELETTRLAKAYYLRGAIKERQRRLREAAQDFKTAHDLSPDWAQARRKVEEYAWAYE
ncbi:MAG: hypothetical protein R3C58_16150 [Parvularculaceae bacterium]